MLYCIVDSLDTSKLFDTGHFYAIGECGGAMQRGTCPECQAPIGGANHQLEASNSIAPEMDGARFPAWSEQANLANYQIPEDHLI